MNSLNSLKVLTKIINNRLIPIVKENVLNIQTGFRPKLATSDSFYSLQKLIQHCNDKNINLPILFVDLKKAFDKISSDWMYFSLKEHNIPDKIIFLIMKIYSTVEIRIKAKENSKTLYSDSIKIENGVLQGDTLSPTLFIIALDSIIRRLPPSEQAQLIEKLIYADDIAFICKNLKETLQKLEKLEELSQFSGLKVSIEKTKLLWTKKVPKTTLTEADVRKYQLPIQCTTCFR